jgi:nucleoside-diphosphate-sugar epimerase
VSDPGFEYDVNRRIPSVEKAENILGFRADVTLETMLDEVIEWIMQAISDGTI